MTAVFTPAEPDAMQIGKWKSPALLLLALFGLFMANDYGLARRLVHNHYLKPQNSLYTEPVSVVDKIKWAYLQDGEVIVCIYGNIKAKPAPQAGYTTVSTYRQAGRAVPQLADASATFLASFKQELASRAQWNNWANTIIIPAATIMPECGNNAAAARIPVFDIAGDLRAWLAQNRPDQDFLYNGFTAPRAGLSRRVGSHYVLVRDQEGARLEYPFALKIQTSIERNDADLLFGILLYPVAIVVDLVTAPLQFVVLHLPWG